MPQKAMEYQRTALTTTDPTVRRKYLHLAELWREMADEAKRRINASSQHEGKGVVLFLTDFKGRRFRSTASSGSAPRSTSAGSQPCLRSTTEPLTRTLLARTFRSPIFVPLERELGARAERYERRNAGG